MVSCCGCHAATQAGLQVHHGSLMQEPQILIVQQEHAAKWDRDTHVTCFLSRKYSSFFRPMVRRRRTSSLSTYETIMTHECF